MVVKQPKLDLRTRDRDVRVALHATVLNKHRSEPDTLVLDELGLWYGTARVDIAVVNGSMHGYEIKSDHDTLDRLEAQAAIYSRVLDEITLVVGPRHLEHAQQTIPEWWGITIARKTQRSTRFKTHRRAKMNRQVDALAVAAMLWCEELIEELERHGAARGVRGKARAIMAERLASTLSLDELRATVRRRLKARADWRGVARQT